jgi:hypothetical protein
MGTFLKKVGVKVQLNDNTVYMAGQNAACFVDIRCWQLLKMSIEVISGVLCYPCMPTARGTSYTSCRSHTGKAHCGPLFVAADYRFDQ